MEKRTMLDVNGHIREAAVAFDGADARAMWDFMCECDLPECTSLVRMTVGEYDLLRASEAPVLAAGHALSRVVQAQRKAAALVEEATALGAQAEQQIRRARKRRGGRSVGEP